MNYKFQKPNSLNTRTSMHDSAESPYLKVEFVEKCKAFFFHKTPLNLRGVWGVRKRGVRKYTKRKDREARSFLNFFDTPFLRNIPNVFRRTCGMGMVQAPRRSNSFSHFSGNIPQQLDPSYIFSSAEQYNTYCI
jgi:hypothetical protein